MEEINNTEQDANVLALYQSLIYGNEQLLMRKARKSIDITKETKLSSSKKLILVHGYIKDEYKYFSVLSNDIVLLIYYFYDTTLQRSYLSPYYYRVFYLTRPFGIAVCRKLEKKYLCIAMPNSPAGKLGLRAGSKLIAYNNYVFDKDDIAILNEQFIETKHRQFAVNCDVQSILMSDSCLPLTLYLKYDPIDLLEKMDESISSNNTDNCNFFPVLHTDTLRWAIDGKVECYKITHINGCDVFSALPIQSHIIQNNLQKKIHDLHINDMNNNKWDEIMSECVQYDNMYFKVGHLEYGDIVKCYGCAGCYMYCVRPIEGWIKFVGADGNNLIVKFEKYTEELEAGAILLDDAKMSSDSKYHFKFAILTKYIRQSLLCEHVINNIEDDESDDFDRYYNLMDILNAIESRESTQCFKVIYFMHMYTMPFSSHSEPTQEKHIKILMNITNDKNAELIIITIQNNVSHDYNVKLPMLINGVELRGYIVGRTAYNIFDKYDLENQVSSFRFGILMLGPSNQIFIRPKEVINESTFRKIQYLIQGRRLSKITNLLTASNKSVPLLNRTLSVESD